MVKKTRGAIYLAIKDNIEQRIKEGEIPLGARLPSERDLAIEYGVNRATIRR
ncbi:MAG: GntR family transcriptional regulator, partial [bacterium]